MRRSTVVIVLLFVIMAGLYYYMNHRAKPADIAVTPGATSTPAAYLFKAEDGQPTGIRIEPKTGEVFEMARNADKAWALKLPIAASAEQGSAEAAASQVSAIRITEQLASTVSPKDVGLDAPDYKLIIKFTSGVERKAAIGVVTTSGSGYYAMLEGGNQIVIISKDAIDSLLGLLTNPPYAQTPTPSLTPSPTSTVTETPLPTTPPPATPTEATATPKP